MKKKINDIRKVFRFGNCRAVVTLPSELGFQPGDLVTWQSTDEGLVLKRVKVVAE